MARRKSKVETPPPPLPSARVLGPPGVWLAAGTSLADPYPCRCEGRRCWALCPCAGRRDHLGGMPRHCCALGPGARPPVAPVAIPEGPWIPPATPLARPLTAGAYVPLPPLSVLLPE